MEKSNSLLLNSLLLNRNAEQAVSLSRFFKTGRGEYGEGDRFLGIKVPVTRQIVKQCWQHTTWQDLEVCVSNEFHEVRLAALLSLVQIFRHARKDEFLQRQCVDFYLSHTKYVNNWDLVDLSCYELLGTWLLDKNRDVLYHLVREGGSIWEQRIGMVSTLAFVRRDDLDDTYALAELFLEKETPLHDLLQKAVGWLLREAGKHDISRFRDWLMPRLFVMPRTMLRYAIEKFPEEERKQMLKG